MPRVVDKQAYFRKVGYRPHPKQLLFHNSKARYRIPVCGRRFGKSKMAGTDREPELLVPKRREWIVGPTYDLAEKEFRVIWEDMIVNLGLGRDKRIKKAYNKKQGVMFIEFPWQTRLECRSAEHPDNLVGDSLDHVIMSEAAKHKKETFERYIRAALSDRRGTADFPTTPEGFNWIHEMWEYGQNPDFPEYESWHFPSWTNPHVFPDGRNDPEIRAVERTTTKAWFDQEYGADFTAFVGKIYAEWQESVHVKPHTFNPEWANYIAFDWGFTNPMAAVEFQVDPFDRVYVWRLWYKRHMHLPTFIASMKEDIEVANIPGYKIDLTFGDCADPGAVAYVCEHFHPCWAMPQSKHGTVEGKGKQTAQSGWREGVELVGSFLKMREPSDNADLSEMVTQLDLSYADSLREPSLYVDPSCKDLIREFNNYKAPEQKTTTNVREAAQKYDDHALDALRYGLMHVFKLGARYHLTDVYSQGDFTDLPDSGYFTNDMRF